MFYYKKIYNNDMDKQLVITTIARVLVLFTSIPVHELAHGWVALRLGDPTAKRAGRLTLNPLKHFNLMGTLCLLIAGFGWANPVPIDPRYFRNPKSGMALTAAAGPLSNLVMAALAMVFYKAIVFSVGYVSGVLGFVETVLMYMVYINVVLCVFNLIPIPPMDGSRIFTFFLPEKVYFGIMKYERYIFLALAVLIFTGVLNRPISAVTGAVVSALDVLTRWVDLLAAAL